MNQSLYNGIENYSRDFEGRNLTSHIAPVQNQTFSNQRDVEFIPNAQLYSGGNNYYQGNNNSYNNGMNNSMSFSNSQLRYSDNNQDNNYSRMGSVQNNFTSNQNISRSGKNLGPNSQNSIAEPSQQSQQYRHARRIYLGGIPPNYADEEALKNFLNNVIAKGLGEENDHTYVVSIYINQKKCFAFVELKSVELATACLDLDGIIYKKVILKVLRAKEYQPELLPPSFLVKSIRFDLTSFAFGCPATPVYNPVATDGKDYQDTKLDSIIQFSNLTAVTRGSVVIVGFPFDDNAANPTNIRGKVMTPQGSLGRGPVPAASSINAPKYFRNSIHKGKYGSVDNPEYAIDLAVTKMFDVGDVLGGKNSEETKLNLTATVTELISRGGIPFVIGGSADQVFHNALGLVAGVNSSNVGVLCISAQLDSRLLDDPKFCPPKPGQTGPASCDGRYIRFAAQGSQCTSEVAQYIGDRGGQVVWYGKHLRNPASKYTAAYQFKKVLSALSTTAAGAGRPVYVSLDVGAMSVSAIQQVYTSNSPIGLTVDEVLDMTMIAGANPNVVLFDVVEFIPTPEDSRYNLFLAELYYKFSLGVASRAYIQGGADAQTMTTYPASSQSSLSGASNAFDDPNSSSMKPEMKPLTLSGSGSSMSSLAKLSLKPPTSSLSSSAPEYSPPVAPSDSFLQQSSGSGKQQGRFGQIQPLSLSTGPYGNFSSNLSVGSDDLTSHDLNSPYSHYFDSSGPQQLDLVGGGTGTGTGGGGGGGGAFFSNSFSQVPPQNLPRTSSSNHSKNSIESSPFLSQGFSNGELPSPQSLSAFSSSSGKHKPFQPGSMGSQMLFSGFGMDQGGGGGGAGGGGVGIGILNSFPDGMNVNDPVYNPPQFGASEQRRYGSPIIGLQEPSQMGASGSAAASPTSYASQHFGHNNFRGDAQPALPGDGNGGEAVIKDGSE